MCSNISRYSLQHFTSSKSHHRTHSVLREPIAANRFSPLANALVSFSLSLLKIFAAKCATVALNLPIGRVRFDGSSKSVIVCRCRPSYKSLKTAETELSKLYYLSHKFVGESGSALAFLICFFSKRNTLQCQFKCDFFRYEFFFNRERVQAAVEPCLPR